MRLIKIVPGRDFEFTEDLDEDDIPQYAILSHTWGAEGVEVIYEDVTRGKVCKNGKRKSGYEKLIFCGEQARRDGQRYFWVDTCCIDKTNSVELNTAITSMFQWYAKANKCYVYLSDVDSGKTTWESDFRNCRWLTRGWTLQELLAPQVVEFYDKAHRKIGDRSTLEHHICDVTGIPAVALRGRPLSSFSPQEHFSWQRNRRTKKPEDEAYSLSGICGVSMIPIYGEGRDKAMARLRREIDDMLKGQKRDDFSIPFSEAEMLGVNNFVGREKELEDMHSALAGDGSRRTVVLHGLGGIGKTQLAIAYAKRHKDGYSAIFWLNMQDETSAKQSIGAIGRRILRYYPSARYLSEVDLTGNLDDVVEATMAWLAIPNNTRWLAIYDNYDNPRTPSNKDPTTVNIRDFLPDAYQGSIMVTTQSSQVKIGRAISVRKLSNAEESVQILSATSGRALSVDDSDVMALVKKLDGLPLALATTGSYLDQVSISIAEYLTMHESSWSQLHENDPGLETYENRTLYSTWYISINRIKQQNELSARLLGLWCYFSNQDLWFELIRNGPKEQLPWLRSLTANLEVFTEAMRLLCNFGLAEAGVISGDTVESGGYSIHACVHSWTIHALNREWNNTLADFATRAIAWHIPSEDTRETIKPWAMQRRLLRHAERSLVYLPNSNLAQDTMEQSQYMLGNLFFDQRKIREAEEIYLRALKDNEASGRKDYCLIILNSLGILYSDQDKIKQAEETYLRALKEGETADGEISTVETVVNLAALYCDQGKFKEAEEMYVRVLKGCKKTSEPKHILALCVINNLGNLFSDQGRIDDAEKMYVQALKGKEEVFGPKDSSTLATIGNLGAVYSEQGRMKESEEMYLRALAGYEEALEPMHPLILKTVNNLGNLYHNQGNLIKAEEMHSRALEGKEETLGPKHSSTLTTVLNLGRTYCAQGRKEAKDLFLRALRGNEELLGASHTSTLDALYNLSLFHQFQGDNAEAERACLDAIERYEHAEGEQEGNIEYIRKQLSTLRNQKDLSPDHRNDSLHNVTHRSEANRNVCKVRKRDRLLRALWKRHLRADKQRQCQQI